jgi:hypothetical protein
MATLIAAVTSSYSALGAAAIPLAEDPIDVTSTSSLSPLDCDAYDSLMAGNGRVVQSSYDDGDGSDKNSDGSGRPRGVLSVATQPPSVAPSMAPPCSDPLSNARGQYTSTMAPCIIKFHDVSNHQREGQEEEDYLIDYHTSHLCHDSNIIVEIKEYLTAWPDECVGDFARCYRYVQSCAQWKMFGELRNLTHLFLLGSFSFSTNRGGAALSITLTCCVTFFVNDNSRVLRGRFHKPTNPDGSSPRERPTSVSSAPSTRTWSPTTARRNQGNVTRSSRSRSGRTWKRRC